MTTYTASTTVAHDVTSAFGFIADPTNLPHYFPRVTAAELVEPQLVRTTAVVDEDRDGDDEPVTSDAWFHADPDNHEIRWGSPGDRNYHGSLSLRPDERQTGVDQTTIELSVTTVSDYPGVQDSLEQALAAITRRLDDIAAGAEPTSSSDG